MRALLLSVLLIGSACAPISAPISFANQMEILDASGFARNQSVVVPGEQFESRMIQLAQHSPCLVIHMSAHPTLMGLTAFDTLTNECVIYIAHNTSNTEFATLLHETAHAVAYLDGVNLVHPDSEVTAEVVAFLVAQHLGLDTFRQSGTYLIRVVPDARERFQIIQRYSGLIEKWVAQIIALCEQL